MVHQLPLTLTFKKEHSFNDSDLFSQILAF